MVCHKNHRWSNPRDILVNLRVKPSRLVDLAQVLVFIHTEYSYQLVNGLFAGKTLASLA